MPLEEDDMWMENLEEFVFEDRRAVTYKWLSRFESFLAFYILRYTVQALRSTLTIMIELQKRTLLDDR